MSTDQHFRQWIERELVPRLVKGGTLTPQPIVAVKSTEIRLQSHNEVFSLTYCYFVDIGVAVRDAAAADSVQIFSVVVKLAPKLDQQLYEKVHFRQLFANEIFTYEHIRPSIRCLANGLKYFDSHNTSDAAGIVLSDFTKDGWTMSTASFNLSIDHILRAVELLGRFHGNMYALKLTDYATFARMTSGLTEARFSADGPTSEWTLRLNFGVQRAIRAVDQCGAAKRTVPTAFLHRLSAIMPSVYDYQWDCVRPREPYAVICHGDYLRNNVAFRYDGRGQATDAMMFDFQTMRYASPMIDLATFMANSTGCDVRNEHFERIFGAYHSALVTELLANASGWRADDVPEYLSHDNMLREYARYMPFGLAVAGSFLQIIAAPTDVFSPGEGHSIDEIHDERRIAEIKSESFATGGEMIDKELRALVVDMHHLYRQLNMELEGHS